MTPLLFNDHQAVIRKNHSSAFPNRLLFLDTETKAVTRGDETRHTFRMGWTYTYTLETSGEKSRTAWKFWTDAESLCKYIDSRVTHKKALYVYGHNIYFDLQVSLFFQLFPKWGWKLEFFYDKGLTYILVIKKDQKTIKVISTTNYFDFNLKALGDEVGLQKLDVDFGNATFGQLKTYCQRDVEITVAALDKYMSFNREHDTGKFGLTKASQAFSAYRHRFMSRSIHLHRDDLVTALERSAYFGGRTEAFHFGKVPGDGFAFLDVNSMYPYVMKENYFPSRLLLYVDEPTDKTLKVFTDKCCVVAEVELETDTPVYAVHHHGKTIFPIGRFVTSVCTEGYHFAKAYGHVKRVIRIAVYERSRLFGDYVDYFYPLKQKYKRDGNQIFTRMVKLYLNSLYGKFGQKYTEQEITDDPFYEEPYRLDCYDTDTGKRWTETHLFGVTIKTLGETEGKQSFAAIPAHVTEYGRFLLWRIINSVPKSRVFYCDTDSVAIRSADLGKVKYPNHQSKLGALSVDRECTALTIFGAKDYQTDGLRKTKGVPKIAEHITEHSYQYQQFLGMASHIRLGESGAIITRRVIKRVEPKYDKGLIASDGTVTPIVLSLP